MRIVAIVARVLLGLAFAAAGASGFYLVAKGAPPVPGLAGEFQHAFFASRYVLFIDVLELVAGVLLLANRYVALALIVLAAVLYNILVFHITMAPSGIIPGLVLTICWFIVAHRHRAALLPLLSPRA
jgi:putative oxidoreductase